MIGTFKANNPYNNFLLLIYGILLKLPMFLKPKIPQAQMVDGLLYRAILNGLNPIATNVPLIYSIVAFILLYTQSITLNKLVNETRLFAKPNYLTAMSYLLISSLFPVWNILTAPLIISSLVIWVWAKMCHLQNNTNAKTTLFNMGLAIGISTFFYFPSLAFILLIVFGLVIIRPFKLSEWLIALFGVFTPYYFVIAYFFLTDKWKSYKLPGFAITLPYFNQNKWIFSAIILIAFLTIVGIVFVNKNFRKQLIQTRKSWSLLFLYLILSLCIPFINATHSFQYWILCAVPLSTLIAAVFYYSLKKTIPLVLHWLIVILVVIINYFI